MTKGLVLAILLGFIHHTSAHYNFGYLEFNGTRSQPWEYIRNVTVDPYSPPYPLYGTEYYQRTPHRDLLSPDFTCGRLAVTYALQTSTASIKAGSDVSFRVLPWIEEKDMSARFNNTIFHDGPAAVFLAKVPEGKTLKDWDGADGNWFKIAEWLAENATTWIVDQATPAVNFTIPLKTPPGTYLMRVEQYAFEGPRTPDLQFYMNCAHVEIIGPGGGTPKEFAKFPGAYDRTAMARSFRDNGRKDFTLWKGAGPAVWKGD